MNVMIQVSDVKKVKDPAEEYDSCIDANFGECLATIARLKQTSKSLFVRWFILHDDGSETHHGENQRMY